MFDVQIEKYSLATEWGVRLLTLEVGSPEADTKFKEVPGRNGDLDLTEIQTGYTTYKNATMKLTFDFVDGDYGTWLRKGSEIFNALHGKRGKVYLGNEKTFYYEGRISIDTEKINKQFSKIEIEVNRDPYKYEKYSSTEDWLWDDFSFEDGIIREYKGLTVSGSLELHIPGRTMPVIPEFDCSIAMSVTHNGKTFSLPARKSKAPDLLLMEGDNVLTFSGNGTVSVEYRGGSL